MRKISAGWHFLLGTILCATAWVLSESSQSFFWPSMGFLLGTAILLGNHASTKRTAQKSFGPVMRQSAIVLAVLFLIAPLQQEAFGVASGYLASMGCAVFLCQIRRRSVMSWQELWR